MKQMGCLSKIWTKPLKGGKSMCDLSLYEPQRETIYFSIFVPCLSEIRIKPLKDASLYVTLLVTPVDTRNT